jgi:hypothetical protein
MIDVSGRRCRTIGRGRRVKGLVESRERIFRGVDWMFVSVEGYRVEASVAGSFPENRTKRRRRRRRTKVMRSKAVLSEGDDDLSGFFSFQHQEELKRVTGLRSFEGRRGGGEKKVDFDTR